MKNGNYKALFEMHDIYESYVNETEKKLRYISSCLNHSLELLDETDENLKLARHYLNRTQTAMFNNIETIYSRSAHIIEKHKNRLEALYQKDLSKVDSQELQDILLRHAFKQYESLCDIDTLILTTCADIYGLKNEFGHIFDMDLISKAEVECNNIREMMSENLVYLNSLQNNAELYKKANKR